MANNHFIWADLSAKEINKARAFYRDALGWDLYEDGKDYFCSFTQQQTLTAIYPMPEQFKTINMPSFWMSYIEVEDIYQTVAQAKKLGAKIEIEPESAFGSDMVALIRDPSGAGFTCIQGKHPKPYHKERDNLIWHELHVNQISLISDFYCQLFSWKLKNTETPGRKLIKSAEGNAVGSMYELSDNIKGPKQYWAIYFLVDDLDNTVRSIKKAGGELVEKTVLGEQPAVLVTDNQGGTFFISHRAVETKKQPGWFSGLFTLVSISLILLWLLY